MTLQPKKVDKHVDTTPKQPPTRVVQKTRRRRGSRRAAGLTSARPSPSVELLQGHWPADTVAVAVACVAAAAADIIARREARTHVRVAASAAT